MTFFTKKNFARGGLASGITAGATQMTLTAGHTLPTSGSFRATIWNIATYDYPPDDPNMEIVTAVLSSGNTYNITRAQEGTLAATHSAGDRVALQTTAGLFQELETNIPTADEKAALVGTNGVPSATNKFKTNSDLRFHENSGASPNDDIIWQEIYLRDAYTNNEAIVKVYSNKNGLSPTDINNALNFFFHKFMYAGVWPLGGAGTNTKYKLPLSPYTANQLLSFNLWGDYTAGDHLFHASTQAKMFKRLPHMFPYMKLTAGITNVETGAIFSKVAVGESLILPAGTYRAVIWGGSNLDEAGSFTTAEIVQITVTHTAGLVSALNLDSRGLEGSTAQAHSTGDYITRALNISVDTAVSNILSGITVGSNEHFGGSGISYAPIGLSTEENGYVEIVAYGRGTTGKANSILFKTKTPGFGNTSLERVRITPDGDIRQAPDGTAASRYSLCQNGIRAYANLTNIAWTDVATIVPNTVTNLHGRGCVKIQASAQVDAIAGGHYREELWYFDYAGAAPTVVAMGMAITSGSNPPAVQLVPDGNNVKVQVKGNSGAAADTSVVFGIMTPYTDPAVGVTWGVS